MQKMNSVQMWRAGCKLSVGLYLARCCLFIDLRHALYFKGELSDSFTNYKYVRNTKVSVSIKKTYANKCTLSEIFLTEILKSFSVF